ncbi:hypothetical protein [Streptomyces sp. NPDC059479]|uniref:hypothetical protein n=1 Tax=Streptomyces sp. NPDC059479 TaxID=3346848 RepID=UPI0036982A1A
MGTARILLPPLRLLARVGVRAGGPLFGAALTRCLTPGWVLLRPRSRWDGMARSLALYAHVLLQTGRYEDALAAADESLTVPGARASARPKRRPVTR